MENCHSLKCGIWAKSRGARRGSVDRGGGELGGVGKGRVDSYLAGRCFTSRVTTTWLTSIGPPTGRERVGMAQ